MTLEQQFTPLGARSLTAARTGVLVVPSVAMALAAHVLSGGCLQPLGVAGVALVLGLSSWTQLSRPRSTRFTFAWLGLTQLLAHGLLALTCADAPTGSGADRTHALVPSPVAVVLHGLVVVACALTCSRVDRWLCRTAQLAAAIGAAARRVLASTPTSVAPLRSRSEPPRLALPGLAVAPLRSLWAAAAPLRRGPPDALLRR